MTKAAEFGRETIRTEISALESLAENLGESFDAAIELILSSKGRVIVSGMGKSGHIGNKIAATLASTGTPSFFVHPSEASHGDLGMITEQDICIVISNSGETAELQSLLAYVSRFAIPMIAICRQPESTLARHASVTLLLPDAPEACSIGMAPTTSTTATLALGDALAVALMRMRGFQKDDFQVFHPGGKLGAQFLRVKDVMHDGDALPVVEANAPMSEVLIEMTSKGFGVALVRNGDDTLSGIITDGDLRRNLEGLMDRDAGSTATIDPATVAPENLLTETMAVMNELKISALPVVGENRLIVGLIHIHDCLRAGVA